MICAHFGWTWEYLHTGISFNTVQKIMRDLPDYIDDEEEGDNRENVEIKEQNAEDFAKMMNNFKY